jgi:ribosomal protein S30
MQQNGEGRRWKNKPADSVTRIVPAKRKKNVPRIKNIKPYSGNIP